MSSSFVAKEIEKYFPALKSKNFLLFWEGQCISVIGTWMQNVGQAWLVLQLTKSPFLLGLVSTIQFLPMLLFSLFAGIIIDKYPKQKILIITQSIMSFLAFIMSILIWTNFVKYWHIIILAFLLGLTNTVDYPARQAFVSEVVSQKEVMNAVALNSSIFNVARIIGPAIAGILMDILGPALLFFLNAVSFIPVIINLFRIKIINPKNTHLKPKNAFKDIKEGLDYIKLNGDIYYTLLMTLIIGIFALNFNTLIPVFSKMVLHLQAKGFGFLMASLGIGALIASLTVALTSSSGPKSYFLYIGGIGSGIFLTFLGLQKSFLISSIMLILCGFFTVSFTTSANSLIQIKSDDQYRGRVMSAYSLVFGGSSPIGSFYSGTAATVLGSQMTFLINGLITTAGIIFLIYKSKKLRINQLKQII